MKLRSLFLASLAAMAMASCSNNDEVLNNGDDAEKAYLQFSIAMPASPAGTRVADNPMYQVGDDEENEWSTATIFMTYTNGQNASFTFNQEQFKETTEAASGTSGSEPNKNAVWTLKEGNLQEVAPGTVSECVVYLNGTSRNITGLTAATVNLTNYSNDNNFLMNGKGTETQYTFTAGETTAVKAKVSRVVAKIQNNTKTTIGLTPKDKEGFEMTGKDNSTISLVFDLNNYVITNQAMKAEEFGGASATAETDFLNLHAAHATGTQATENWSDFEGSKGFVEDEATYVLANNSETYKSQLIVKATAKIKKDGEVQDAQTFFVFDNIFYATFDELNEAKFSGSLKEEEYDTIEKCAKIGILKYEGGVCYYHANIVDEGDSENQLKANHWYKFNIANVSKLGTPEVGIEKGEPAYLNLEVEIVNWTVWTNDITLE